MNKQELWDFYVSRNPSFNGTENITMTPKGLKKFFDQSYDQAFEQGKDKANSLHKKCNNPKPENPFGDIFGGVFK